MPRISPAISCFRAWSSSTPIISRRTTYRGPRCTGIRSRPWSPTTASSRPAASPPRSIRCAFGARRPRKTSTGRPRSLADAIATARDAELLRLEHFLHLRCEVPMPSVVAEAKALIERADVRLVSLMDHTPGQRQFRDEGKLRDYYRGKSGGMTDAELDVLFAQRIAY